MSHRGRLILLPPNRVWRTYLGGRTLDQLASRTGRVDASPADTHFPEDWIASTTPAINPADAVRFAPKESTVPEGISLVQVGDDSALQPFDALVQNDAKYFFGPRHAVAFGAKPQLLVKLLDPSIRLHFQVHPTAEFARRHLGAPSGKTEAYHIIAVREDLDEAPYIYLGFQRPPDRARLREMILAQDISALEKCFDRIPVNPGDTFLVPGGVPHALGPGLLLAEIMEPSDLAVRFEFARGGYILPEPARFLGRGLDFCLDIFDLNEWPAQRIFTEAICPPRRRRALGPDSWQDDLIGAERTPCFRIRHSTIRASVTRHEHECWIGIVTSGSATFRAGGESHRLGPCEKFFVPAGLGPLVVEPHPEVQVLECLPPAS